METYILTTSVWDLLSYIRLGILTAFLDDIKRKRITQAFYIFTANNGWSGLLRRATDNKQVGKSHVLAGFRRSFETSSLSSTGTEQGCGRDRCQLKCLMKYLRHGFVP